MSTRSKADYDESLSFSRFGVGPLNDRPSIAPLVACRGFVLVRFRLPRRVHCDCVDESERRSFLKRLLLPDPDSAISPVRSYSFPDNEPLVPFSGRSSRKFGLHKHVRLRECCQISFNYKKPSENIECRPEVSNLSKNNQFLALYSSWKWSRSLEGFGTASRADVAQPENHQPTVSEVVAGK